jgi:hypothetical protein
MTTYNAPVPALTPWGPVFYMHPAGAIRVPDVSAPRDGTGPRPAPPPLPPGRYTVVPDSTTVSFATGRFGTAATSGRFGRVTGQLTVARTSGSAPVTVELAFGEPRSDATGRGAGIPPFEATALLTLHLPADTPTFDAGIPGLLWVAGRSMAVRWRGQSPHRRSDGSVRFSGHVVVNRRDVGCRAPWLLGARRVRIEVEATAEPSEVSAAAAADLPPPRPSAGSEASGALFRSR